MPVKEYHTKPVPFEAIQWDGTREAAPEIIKWAMQVSQLDEQEQKDTIVFYQELIEGRDSDYVQDPEPVIVFDRTLQLGRLRKNGWLVLNKTESYWYRRGLEVYTDEHFRERFNVPETEEADERVPSFLSKV